MIGGAFLDADTLAAGAVSSLKGQFSPETLEAIEPVLASSIDAFNSNPAALNAGLRQEDFNEVALAMANYHEAHGSISEKSPLKTSSDIYINHMDGSVHTPYIAHPGNTASAKEYLFLLTCQQLDERIYEERGRTREIASKFHYFYPEINGPGIDINETSRARVSTEGSMIPQIAEHLATKLERMGDYAAKIEELAPYRTDDMRRTAGRIAGNIENFIRAFVANPASEETAKEFNLAQTEYTAAMDRYNDDQKRAFTHIMENEFLKYRYNDLIRSKGECSITVQHSEIAMADNNALKEQFDSKMAQLPEQLRLMVVNTYMSGLSAPSEGPGTPNHHYER